MSDVLGPIGGGGQSLHGFKFINSTRPGKPVTVVVEVVNGQCQAHPSIPNGSVGQGIETTAEGATWHVNHANDAEFFPITGVMKVHIYEAWLQELGGSGAMLIHAPPPYHDNLPPHAEVPCVAMLDPEVSPWFEDLQCEYVQDLNGSGEPGYRWSAVT